MIKIIAVIILWIMCYFLTKKITVASVIPDDYFLWGWLSSVATGFFINWFVKAINIE